MRTLRAWAIEHAGMTEGDARKAKDKLGWVPEVSAQAMCAEMVASDLDEAKRAALLKQHGYAVNVSVE